MARNSRLLACKAEQDKLYIYVKSTLRVSPYFQVLPLFKIFQKKGASYSNHIKVAIKYLS
jgi:hypothetical protein